MDNILPYKRLTKKGRMCVCKMRWISFLSSARIERTRGSHLQITLSYAATQLHCWIQRTLVIAMQTVWPFPIEIKTFFLCRTHGDCWLGKKFSFDQKFEFTFFWFLQCQTTLRSSCVHLGSFLVHFRYIVSPILVYLTLGDFDQKGIFLTKWNQCTGPFFSHRN